MTTAPQGYHARWRDRALPMMPRGYQGRQGGSAGDDMKPPRRCGIIPSYGFLVLMAGGAGGVCLSQGLSEHINKQTREQILACIAMQYTSTCTHVAVHGMHCTS